MIVSNRMNLSEFRFYIGNPSAWDTYDDAMSERMRWAADTIAALQAELAEAKVALASNKLVIDQLAHEKVDTESALAAANARIGELEANISSLSKRAIDATFWANQTGDKLADANARAERAEANVKVLREALEPFAKVGDTFKNFRDTDEMVGWRGLNVGNFRNARAVLAQTQPPAPDGQSCEAPAKPNTKEISP